MKIERISFPDADTLVVSLSDGCRATVPLKGFPSIAALTKEERQDFEIIDDTYLSFVSIDELFDVGDLHFASFSEALTRVLKDHFGTVIPCALAFSDDLGTEAKYIMTTARPTGIALLEQAADLARSDYADAPTVIINVERFEVLAQQMLDEYPSHRKDIYARDEMVQIMIKTLHETEQQSLATQVARSWLKQYLAQNPT